MGRPPTSSPLEHNSCDLTYIVVFQSTIITSLRVAISGEHLSICHRDRPLFAISTLVDELMSLQTLPQTGFHGNTKFGKCYKLHSLLEY